MKAFILGGMICHFKEVITIKVEQMLKRILLTLLPFLLLMSSLFGQQQKPGMQMHPALLIIDVQKEFLPMMSKDDKEFAVQMMNYSMMVFRQYDLPVIRVYHSSNEYGVTPGSPGFEFIGSLEISPEDPQIIKTYPSSFTQTALDSLLQSMDVNTLFLCGLSSVGCVLATYMDATAHDYKAFMIKDAMLSHKASYTDQIEEIFSALDLETVMFMIEVGRKE